MITVAVYINNQPIILKTARNLGESSPNLGVKYQDESGTIIWHDPQDGAAELSKKLLELWEPPKHG